MDSTLTKALEHAPDGVVIGTANGRLRIATADGTTRELTMAQARDERLDPSCMPAVLPSSNGGSDLVLPVSRLSVWEIADSLSLWAEQTDHKQVGAALANLGFDVSTRGPVNPDNDVFVALSECNDAFLADIVGQLVLQLSSTGLNRLS